MTARQRAASRRAAPWLLPVALAALAVVEVSCRPDGGHTDPLDVGPPPLLGVSAEQQSALEQQLEAEKQRIYEESERSKAVYDSLKAEWDRYLKDYEVTPSGIIYCDPLQYAADAKIVGPDGADISIGPHKLRIPRGALKDYVVVTGEMPVSLWVGVRLSPQELAFAIQPELTLSYKHCYLPAAHRERVAYVDDALNVLEYPSSRDQTKNGLVDAWLWHFSNYAIAW